MSQSSIISRPFPNAVTYDLSDPHKTTIKVPSGSRWSSGLHWHETHAEYLQVIKGSVCVRLYDDMLVLGPEETAKVERYARHEWQRADFGKHDAAEDVMVIENTEPMDVSKSIFFWALNGVILSGATAESRSQILSLLADFEITIRLFVIFHALDNWPVLVELRNPGSGTTRLPSGVVGMIEWLVTHFIIITAAACIGWLIGWKAVDEKFVPHDLAKAWKTQHSTKENNKTE